MAYDVILLNGMPQASEFITFEPQTYHFYNENGVDLTSLIARADKLQLVPGFDIAIDNDRLYREQFQAKTGKAPPPVGSTSVTDLFVSNVEQTLATGTTAIGGGIKDTVQTAVIFGIAGLVVYMLLKK